MTTLQLNAYSTQGIALYPAQGLMVAEASDLGLRPGHVWEQLYDDACDVGIALRSHKTGVVTTWYLCEGDTVKDADGDILWWVLKPTTETVRSAPTLAAYRLKVFND